MNNVHTNTLVNNNLLTPQGLTILQADRQAVRFLYNMILQLFLNRDIEGQPYR